MKRCAKCRVPLEGKMFLILEKIFRLKTADSDPTLCNKCAPRPHNREIEEKAALTHIRAEEYLLGLIKKDHPEWKESDPACAQCISYYRELIKKAKI
jgi:protein-arginine kinase activator protein McsA